ncbi:hypothetical protein CHS0354_037784 [Potamilus streckersoni]|uniref:Nucleolar protein 14 n=1 Tax=Potamilus streckersoni TaxID=2493646 RepID=A0AAE0T3G3_9BIVA|nr:hypothetical protein CHS0354_037784 [Potamilus streckersoni]
MAKKRKQLADKIRVSRNKRKETPKTVNPFEVKINHQKHDVLGRKISKHDKGMPGLSRSKATKKRKETLLQEYENQFKANKFVDQRFGETDTSLSLEDKMLKRFAIEKLKMADKHSKFNLNEDEELTHYGQSLSQIEKFEDPDDSDEEDDDNGRIGAKMVSEEHFGGFMTRKEAEDARDARSWKEKMEDVIAKSKKEKYDRQMEKEKTKEMTEKLDEEWSSLRLLISSLSKAKGSKGEETVQKKVDDYDIAVRELQFEMKGKATDRMKTEEEIAREEKEKLEKLEADRIRRMKGMTEEETSSGKHFSADDLDDGFVIDGADKEKFQVSYKDGKMVNYEDVEAHVSAEDKEGDEKNDSDVDEDDDEKGVTEENEEEEEEESGDDSDNSDDSFGDIASEDEEAEENGDKQEEEEKGITISLEQNRMSKEFDHKTRKMMEAAKKEIPYTFSVPENYEALLDLLQENNILDQITIMQRVRTCHHPSLAEGNKSLLETFFGLLVQYYGDLALQKPPQLHLMDQMTPILYSLTQQSPVAAAQAVVEQIANRQKEFKQICDRRAGRGMYPGLDTLLMFKLVSMLFPTSDFYHPVTTPALLFLCQMLAQCSISQERDVAAGLFVCSICLEYVSLSKRYIPEVVNFLHGLLFLAAEKDPNKIEPVIPPFKPVGKNVNLLLLSKAMSGVTEIKKWKMSELLSINMERQATCNDEFRLSAINNSLILIREFSNLYAELPSYKEIFTPITNMCKKLPVQDFPTALQKNLKNLMENICANCQRKRQFLVIQKKKPQPLKMYEPKVEEVFDGKKNRQKGTKDFNEHQKLVHKHKRELKGAIREIKKDNQFLARQKLQKQLLLDAERKRKMKQIFAMLSAQEGDYKAMKRRKVE